MNGMNKPKIPNFEILDFCGSGGSSTVWVGRDADGIKRAIRVLDIASALPEQVKRETDAVALFRNVAVRHKNLLDMLYIGKTSKYLYYVTPLADNAAQFSSRYIPDTLAVRIQNGTYKDKDMIGFIGAILDAVESLHANNIAHRDLKPENILFVGGELKIADPGLISPSGSFSKSGTGGYLPPWPDATGIEADLYAVGKIIYCLYTGNDVLQFPELPEQLRGGAYAPLLNDLALRCCSPDKKERFKSITELRAFFGEIASIRKPSFLKSRWKDLLIVLLLIVCLLSFFFNLRPFLANRQGNMSKTNGLKIFNRIKLESEQVDIATSYASITQLRNICPALRKDADFQAFYKQTKDHYEWITFQSVPDHVMLTLPIISNIALPVPISDRIEAYDRYFSMCKDMTMYPQMLFEYYAFLKLLGRDEKAQEVNEVLRSLSTEKCNSVALAYACMRMANLMVRCKQMDNALFFAKKAQQAAPNIHAVYVVLFQVYYLMDKKDDAAHALLDLKRTKPDSLFIRCFFLLLNDPEKYKQELIEQNNFDYVDYPISLSDYFIHKEKGKKCPELKTSNPKPEK